MKANRENMPDLIKLCNCAQCGQEMLGRACRALPPRLLGQYRKMPMIHGRLLGRPYCRICYLSRARSLNF